MDQRQAVADRRAGVLGAISLIRCLFEVQHLDVSVYSDAEIVDAWLEVRPEADKLWLSEPHIARTFDVLTRQMPPDADRSLDRTRSGAERSGFPG